MRRGYPTPKTGPIHCMVENVNMVVVNFDGVIYKCPAFVGNPDFAAGDVETGLRDYTETYQVGRWKTEECLECEYLPLCFGGCRYMSFIREGHVEAFDCQKPWFDTVLERIIRQDVTLRIRRRSVRTSA